jgi:hypothetical protein
MTGRSTCLDCAKKLFGMTAKEFYYRRLLQLNTCDLPIQSIRHDVFRDNDITFFVHGIRDRTCCQDRGNGNPYAIISEILTWAYPGLNFVVWGATIDKWNWGCSYLRPKPKLDENGGSPLPAGCGRYRSGMNDLGLWYKLSFMDIALGTVRAGHKTCSMCIRPRFDLPDIWKDKGAFGDVHSTVDIFLGRAMRNTYAVKISYAHWYWDSEGIVYREGRLDSTYIKTIYYLS